MSPLTFLSMLLTILERLIVVRTRQGPSLLTGIQRSVDQSHVIRREAESRKGKRVLGMGDPPLLTPGVSYLRYKRRRSF